MDGEFSRQKFFPRDCRTELSCGCVIKTRAEPMTEGARFPCPSNAGHGYNLPWIKAWKVGREDKLRINQKFVKNEEGNGR